MFVTKFVTRITNFVTCIRNFVTSVTKFVIKNISVIVKNITEKRKIFSVKVKTLLYDRVNTPGRGKIKSAVSVTIVTWDNVYAHGR